MNFELEIRDYQSNDFDAVVRIWQSVFPPMTGHNDPAASIQAKLAEPNPMFFVACREQLVIGTVMIGYDGHRGWIYSLAVAPENQRAGIGTALVRHGERILEKLGCLKINLQIRGDDQELVAFYQSLGFQVEPRISMGKRVNTSSL